MCHAGTKSARPSITPLSETQWGLPLTEPPRSYSLDYNRISRSDGRKLLIPSTSRTPAARRGKPPTNLLARLDAPPACAPSRQSPSSRNWWRMGHTRLATASPPGSPARSCPTYGRFPTPECHSISQPFRPDEFPAALRHLKPGKSPGLDSIFPEFLLHAGSALRSWFCDFLNSCMRPLKTPKIWRRALVVAIPKPEKPLGRKELSSYISALCPLQKPRETHLRCVEPIINPLLPQEQAGFWHGRSAVDQVTLLTQDIEDSFSAKKKAGAVFVDLTAAYNTVWHRGLTCKLLRLLPDLHMVHMIIEMVSNRSFTLTTGNGLRSRIQRLKNGVPQGSVMAHLLFSIYISDLPATISRKYAYADDLAIIHANGDWLAVEEALSKDMATLGEYIQTWELKLSTTKTVSAVFHLNNKEAKREL